jgi:CarD family transcriptional regulator
MPSAKKNEEAKGASVTTAPRRSSGAAGKAVLKVGSASPTPGAPAKTSSVPKSSAKSTATRSAAASAKTSAVKTEPAKSAAKTARTAEKTSARAPVADAAASAGVPAPSARASAAMKNSAARGGPVAAPAKHAAGKATAANPAGWTVSAATEIQQPVMATAKPAAVTTAGASGASAPVAPSSAAHKTMRGVSPPFHGGASAPARKTFPTPSAGEDKKLSKRSEHPDTTATSVAAEKTSIESKSAPKAAAPIKAKPANGSKLGFKLNEFIVYPAHGVGQIIGVETQEVAGFSLELFVVSFIKDKMILKVPTSKVANVGMRKLAEANVVDKALGTLSGRARIKRTMWSRRAQEYEAKINSGDLVTIAEVVRDLYRSDTQPEQSYSERQLYEAALDRMAREVAAVRKLIDSEALKLIESFLQKGPRRGQKADADVAEVDDAEEADEEDVDRAA